MMPAFNTTANNAAAQEELDSALLRAAFFDENEKITDMIRRGADKNARYKNGDTPLILAAREGHEKTVRLLLKHHVDTSACNDLLESAVDAAQNNGHLKIAARIAARDVALHAQKEKEFIVPILEGSQREITALKPPSVIKRRTPKPV